MLLARGVVGKRIERRVLLLQCETEAAYGNERGQSDVDQSSSRGRKSSSPVQSIHDLVHQFARRFFPLISARSIIEYRFGRTQREPMMRRSLLFLSTACAYAILSLTCPFATAQIDNSTPEWKNQQSRGQMEDAANQASVKQNKVPKEVKVTVEADKPRGAMAPWVMAVHGLVSDAHML